MAAEIRFRFSIVQHDGRKADFGDASPAQIIARIRAHDWHATYAARDAVVQGGGKPVIANPGFLVHAMPEKALISLQDNGKFRFQLGNNVFTDQDCDDLMTALLVLAERRYQPPPGGCRVET